MLYMGIKLIYNQQQSTNNNGDSGIQLNDYDWKYLHKKHGIYTYDDGNYHSITGIDVSDHQGKIDWARVKKAGIDFAMIRCGYRGYSTGLLNQDDYYEENITQALNNNLKVGVYWISQAIKVSEANEEAEYVLTLIRNHQISGPIAFDMEEVEGRSERINNLTLNQRTKIALAFCDKIINAGYETMIYGNDSWLQSAFKLSKITQYPIWYAGYLAQPGIAYQFKMWQYTSSGTIDGINGYVDLNLWFIKG